MNISQKCTEPGDNMTFDAGEEANKAFSRMLEDPLVQASLSIIPDGEAREAILSVSESSFKNGFIEGANNGTPQSFTLIVEAAVELIESGRHHQALEVLKEWLND